MTGQKDKSKERMVTYMKKLISILVASLMVGGTAVGAGTAIENNDQAMEVAKAQAGVENVYDAETDRDYENGKEVYEVEFEKDGYEYEYEIDAETGAFLETEKEPEEERRDSESVNTSENTEVKSETNKTETEKTADIGRDEAKVIALEHAGVLEADISNVEIDRDHDDGRLEYGVEFQVGNKEYEYEIDAETGKILEYDIDIDDNCHDDDCHDDNCHDRWDD